MTPGRAKPSKRRLKRLISVLFLDGFRAAPAWMTLVTVMLVVGSVASTCYPLGYRLLVDGALTRSTGHVVWGVVLVGGLISLGWALTAIGATEAMALSDRIATYRTAELIRLISGIAGLEHLERPDYLTEVERLNANRRQLASAPRQLLSNVASAARIIALLVLLASVSPWLLLLPLSAAPPLVADRLAKRITTAADNDMATDRRLASMLFSLATESGPAGEVRSFGLAGHLAAEHRRLSRAIDDRSNREAIAVLAVQGLGWLLYAALLMGAVAFVVIRASDGLISIGTVLMAVSLIRRSRTQLAAAASNSGALVSTLSTADRLFWLEEHAADQAAAAGRNAAPTRLDRGIELRSVSFAYPGTDRLVLQNLNLHLPAGSIVAVLGENGCGKSTLMKLLLGMYRPVDGEVLVDGVPLGAISPQEWSARCTAAFQDFAKFHVTAGESVGMAALPEINDLEAAGAALERAGAGDLIHQLPDGLATLVGTAYTGGRGLSGGQWQKLALGRAMRRPSPLLTVLDEPTASLDAQAEHALFERYSAAARAGSATGGITVLVSHRFSTARMADLIVYLEHGRAVEVGSHSDLIAIGGRYAELFDLQAAGFR